MYHKLSVCIVQALRNSQKTVWWLIKIIIPISLAVSLLQYWGIIEIIANQLTPLFSVVGLPGESAIVFISSLFLSLYGPIAILATLTLNMREITILAVMCLISHNMIVETTIQKKTGSSALIMFSMRIFLSFFTAFVLNLLLPEFVGKSQIATISIVYKNIGEMLYNWTQSAGWLALKITFIITGLMTLQNILKEFKILDLLSKIFAPLMSIMGLSRESSFLWFVAQTLGLTYGSGVMLEAVKKKEITPHNANLLNYHIAINHSLLEDTLLFVAIGVPALWMIIPRFILAIVVVWIVRGFFKLSQRKNHIEKG